MWQRKEGFTLIVLVVIVAVLAIVSFAVIEYKLIGDRDKSRVDDGELVADDEAPSSPLNLVATASSDIQINLSWSAAEDNVEVVGYDVLRSETKGGPYTPVGRAKDTSYANTLLPSGTTYHYVVQAFDAAGNISSNSNEASATTFKQSLTGVQPSPRTPLPSPVSPRPSVSGQPPPPSQPSYTMAEISRHNTLTDCWLLISGRVYDVTRFIYPQDQHPGGVETVLPYCGKDATTAFATKATSPASPHTASAQSMLSQYYIGLFRSTTLIPSPTDRQAPAGLANISPRPAETNIPQNALLTGSLAQDASPPVLYYFEIYQGTVCVGTPIQTRTYGASASWSPQTLLANTTYAWRYKARDVAVPPNESAFSQCTTFTTATGVTQTLSANLTTAPTSGQVPLSVALTAVASGNTQGNVNYTFYCNRSDSGINVTTPYDGKYDNQTSVTRSHICSYQNAGMYSPKVIVESGGKSAEARSTVTVTSIPSGEPQFTMAEISEHTSLTNCWLLISGKVYNVTSYIYPQDKHPGNADTILPVCGKDATTAFATKSKTPSKTHSAQAYDLLATFYIGILGTGPPPPPTGDTQPPTTPSALTASAVSNSQINLTWSASTDNVGVSGYRVLRSMTSGGPYTQVGTSLITSFSDLGLTSQTTYYYVVQAYDVSGNNSANSNQAMATTLAQGGQDTQPPTAPTNLTATAISKSQINLQWSASTDNVAVTGYNVYRSTSPGGSYKKVGTTKATVTSFSNKGLSAKTNYYYVVEAYDAAGNKSAKSNEATAKTLVAAVIASGISETTVLIGALIALPIVAYFYIRFRRRGSGTQ